MTPSTRPLHADAEALLVHAPFLQALARSLLGAGGSGDADDVVQEAFLRASETPPRDAAAGRSWLATVVRRLIAERGRRAPKRSAWERRAARREALPSTSDIVEREAVRRQVVDAVVALEEPYRTVVLLRFYENMTPRAISAELDVPFETVRSQLKRGLATLRERLDDQHDDGQRAWSLALAPLAFPRTAHAGWLANLPVVPKAALAAIATLAIAFTTWSIFLADDVVESSSAGNTVVANLTAPTTGTPPLTNAEDTTHAATPLAIPLRRLSFHAVDVTESAVPNVHIAVVGCAIDDPTVIRQLKARDIAERLASFSGTTDAAGRATFDGVPDGLWIVTTGGDVAATQRLHAAIVLHSGRAPIRPALVTLDLLAERFDLEHIDVRASAGDMTMRLAIGNATRRVDGRVVDMSGDPIGDVEVIAQAPEIRRLGDHVGHTALAPHVAATTTRVHTDASGSFTIETALDDVTLGATCPDHDPATATVKAGETFASITMRRHTRLSVHGVVTLAGGHPANGATVAIGDVDAFLGSHGRFLEEVEREGITTTTTDDNGRFFFEDVSILARGPHGHITYAAEGEPTIAVTASVPDHLPAHVYALTSESHIDEPVTFQLQPGGTLEGTVTLPPQHASEDVEVHLYDHQQRTWLTEVDDTGTTRAFTRWRAQHGAWTAIVEVDGQESDAIAFDWHGEAVELHAVFSAPTWIVDVEVRGASDLGTADERSAGVSPNLHVLAVHESGFRTLADFVEGERWRVSLGRAWPGDDARIVVLCDGATVAEAVVPREQVSTTLHVDADAIARRYGALVIDVSALPPDDGFLAITSSVYHAGDRVALPTKLKSRTTREASSNPLANLLGLEGPETRVLHGRLPPGRYDVVVTPWIDSDAGAVLHDLVVEPGTVTRVVAEPLEFTPVIVKALNVESSDTVRYAVFNADGRRLLQDEVLGSLEAILPRGSYEIIATTTSHSGRVAFDVRDQSPQSISVTLEPAAPTTIRVPPRPAGTSGFHRLTVVDASGRTIAEKRGLTSLATGEFTSLAIALPTGRYDVTFEGPSGTVIAHESVLSGGAAPMTVALDDDN